MTNLYLVTIENEKAYLDKIVYMFSPTQMLAKNVNLNGEDAGFANTCNLVELEIDEYGILRGGYVCDSLRVAIELIGDMGCTHFNGKPLPLSNG